jgi:hypothetical protein
MVLSAQSGCSPAPGTTAALPQVDPLRVRRADGAIQEITLADAMAYHHRHGDHSNVVSSGEQEHEEDLCTGVASGYQAIRFAAAKLFPEGVPNASDIELSVGGGMPGVWDIFELYTGTELARPARQAGKPLLSPASFTFEARRASTGQSIRFRLREGFIPARFFELKAQGFGCDHPEVNETRGRAACRILSTPPEECFDLLD